MKLRNKLSIITATALASFVGVGFAAWTFNNSVAQTETANTYVTSAISAKNVTLTLKNGEDTEVSGLFLVLDQANPYWSVDAAAAGTGAKPAALAGGKIVVAPDYDLQNQNDGASWTYTLTSAIDVASDIATYVNVTGFDTVAKTGTITAAGNEGIAAVEYTLPALSYTASKPANFADYSTMLSAVNGEVITFTFNCTFVED